jgi:protease IV
MKARTALVLVAGLAAVAVGAVAVGAVALLVRGGGRTAGGWGSGSGYLALDLQGALPEQPASGIGSLLESGPPSVRALVEAVDRAAGDTRVEGLLVRVGPLDVGWARVQELRDALVRFRRSGKPSWAHIEFAGNREYFLASACGKVAASPTAMLDVSGLAAEIDFYRGTLDKLGIEAQFEGVGKYKNAPNQLTETGFTAPHREQTEALVDALFGQYVRGVAEARGLAPEAVREIIDRGPFRAEEARESGLVDELLYRDEVESRVPSAGRIHPGRYVKAARSRGLSIAPRPRVALVYAVGDLVPGESQASPFGGTLAGADTIVRGLRDAREDDSVRAILLRVDSPGGSGTASDAVWREVGIARRKKPVVVSMGDYAASGGYYIAMGADAILAQPGTITGSIGVFSGKLSLRGLYGKLGVTRETVRRGRHATLFSSWAPWGEQERAKVRSLNEAFYETFLEKAAEGRKKTAEQIDAVAQGRVWTGEEALAAGLVDSLGGLDAALETARRRARIPRGQEVDVVVLPRGKGLLETLMERQDEDVLARALGPAAASFLRWATVLCDRGPIARVPFELVVR